MRVFGLVFYWGHATIGRRASKEQDEKDQRQIKALTRGLDSLAFVKPSEEVQEGLPIDESCPGDSNH